MTSQTSALAQSRVWTVTSEAGIPPALRPFCKVRPSRDQEDVMSSTRTASRPTARALQRLAARHRVARGQRQLSAVLAGHHGETVRNEVLAAMGR